MSVVYPKTVCNPFRRVLAANSSAAYAAQADTTTVPTFVAADSAAGYIDLCAGDGAAAATPNFIKLIFFGTGSDGQTGKCRVYGVAEMKSAQATAVTSYTHVLLADFGFTLSDAVGVAGGVTVVASRYADTVTRTFGNADVADQLFSPAGSSINNAVAHVRMDACGFRFVKFELAPGTATDVNALWAGY